MAKQIVKLLSRYSTEYLAKGKGASPWRLSETEAEIFKNKADAGEALQVARRKGLLEGVTYDIHIIPAGSVKGKIK